MPPPNTSATGGYLLPDPALAPPIEGQSLDRFLQQIVVAVAGYNPASLVRPRWQPAPPDTPAAPDTDWCAFGITAQRADTYAAIRHESGATLNDGDDQMIRYETVATLLSFYGPNAGAFAEQFREGIQLPQNLEVMQLVGVGFLDTGDIIRLPEKVNDVWQNRMDMEWNVRREIRRQYPILNLLSAQGSLHSDPGTVSIDVTGP
jgi:hypothetical protein